LNEIVQVDQRVLYESDTRLGHGSLVAAAASEAKQVYVTVHGFGIMVSSSMNAAKQQCALRMDVDGFGKLAGRTL
jgi:hypothetical protein